MAKNFPHLNDTSYPNVGNVNVYGYQNDFDFSKFANRQMRIKLMSVPWDLGEVHVGLKSVPIGNVVAFESESERDSWLDSQQGMTFDTRYRAYHEDDVIKLPVPYESVILNNYIVIDYDEMPVEYGNMKRVTRWLYFIRSAKMESVNSTICEIARDTWTMFSNDIDISYLMLERGHAPMFAAPSPSEYLESPITKNDYLLSDDVNFGGPSRANEVSNFIVNDGKVWMCICSSAYVRGDWGKKSDDSWDVPRLVKKTENGNITPYVFAVDVDDRETFFDYIDVNIPQFMQTIQGVFFVPDKLTNIDETFTFGGVTCGEISSSQKTFDLDMPKVESFGYDKNEKGITKLYTSPYAHLELVDEKGDITAINIEDCTGKLSVRTSLSLAWPWINVSAHVNGIGSTATSAVTFHNLTSHEFRHGGRWFETLRRWDIPVMAVYQGNNKTNDYRTHFDRLTQHDNGYRSADTAKGNADRSADTAKGNADRSADTLKTNTDNNANLLKGNTTTQTTANKKVADDSKTRAEHDTWLGNEYLQAIHNWNSGLQYDLVNVDYKAEIQSAGISTTSNIIQQGATGAVTGAAAGSVIPGAGTAAGAALGALAGVASGVVSGITSGYQTATMLNATSDKVRLTVDNDTSVLKETKKSNVDRTDWQSDSNIKNVVTQNSAANSIASDTRDNMKGNATNSRDTAKKNATNLRDTAKSNASDTLNTAKKNIDESISNQQKQAHIMAPNFFGSYKNGENSITRPMGMFLNVVTQSRSAIHQAATQFLRYGYFYNGMWEFDGFNIGKRFTYWKCSDLWLVAQNLPDAFVDQIRNYLLQGVTVWRKPEYINNTSIYDN